MSQSETFTELQTGLKFADSGLFNTSITVQRDDASAFSDDFEDCAIHPVQQTAAALLTTERFRKKKGLRECILGDAEDEGLADEECIWEPRYAIRFAKSNDAEYETRLIGHVEFLAGRAGALTEAYNMKSWNKWGSPRCVLGATPPQNSVNAVLTALS